MQDDDLKTSQRISYQLGNRVRKYLFTIVINFILEENYTMCTHVVVQ